MTRPYSLDLRRRVVDQVLSGKSVRSVAKHFEISTSAVVKWSQRYRQTGSLEPDQVGGHKPFLLTPYRDFIHHRFAQQSDLSLRRLQQELCDLGVEVSYGAVWRFVHEEGLSFKKNRCRKRAR